MPITIENLNFTYSKKSPYEKRALKDINLSIEDGEFFGIIGHTGSGKSTLISHLNALTKIQEGAITVDGIPILSKPALKAELKRLRKAKKEKAAGLKGRTLTEEEKAEFKSFNASLRSDRKKAKRIDFIKLRSTLGMVFQYPEYQLFDESVEKDVGFGPKNLKVPKNEIADRVREAVTLVGLDYESIKARSPFDLSGGQKRRVAIAGVLAMRPKILVLDEPTAGLDPRGKKEILDLILRVKEKMCPTVIMISHNMDEIAAVCDRIGVLHEGELKCVMPPSQLFKNAELLESLDIGMPAVTAIAHALNQNGFTIDEGIVTEDALIDAIDIGLEGRG